MSLTVSASCVATSVSNRLLSILNGKVCMLKHKIMSRVVLSSPPQTPKGTTVVWVVMSPSGSESESFLTMLRYSFWGWFAEDSFCFWGKSIWPGDRGLMLHWLVCQGLLQKAGDAFYEPFMSPVEMMDVTEAFSLWTKSSSFQPDTDHVRKKPQSVIVLIIY